MPSPQSLSVLQLIVILQSRKEGLKGIIPYLGIKLYKLSEK